MNFNGFCIFCSYNGTKTKIKEKLIQLSVYLSVKEKFVNNLLIINGLYNYYVIQEGFKPLLSIKGIKYFFEDLGILLAILKNKALDFTANQGHFGTRSGN